MPVGDRLRLFSDYAASFDTRLRNPRWVLEHVTAAGLAVKGGTRADSQFQEDAGWLWGRGAWGRQPQAADWLGLLPVACGAAPFQRCVQASSGACNPS